MDLRMAAFSPDSGAKLWEFPMLYGLAASRPAVGGDGTIYFGGQNYNVYALNPSGGLKWSLPADNDVSQMQPTIGQDGALYVSTGFGTLYAIGD